MTLTEYLERGYPIKDFAENLESVLLNFEPYAETKVVCRDRTELDRVLDVIEEYFQTLHLGFVRSRYTAQNKPDWFYIYRSGNIHMGGGDRNDLDKAVSLSEILENLVDNFKDVEVCDDLPELDSLFS